MCKSISRYYVLVHQDIIDKRRGVERFFKHEEVGPVLANVRMFTFTLWSFSCCVDTQPFAACIVAQSEPVPFAQHIFAERSYLEVYFSRSIRSENEA